MSRYNSYQDFRERPNDHQVKTNNYEGNEGKTNFRQLVTFKKAVNKLIGILFYKITAEIKHEDFFYEITACYVGCVAVCAEEGGSSKKE